MDSKLYWQVQEMDRAALRAEIDRIKGLPDLGPSVDYLLPGARTNWLDIQRAKALKDELARKGYIVSVQSETEIVAGLPFFNYAIYVRERPTSKSDLVMFHGSSEEEVICRAYVAIMRHVLAGALLPVHNPGGWNYRVVHGWGEANGRRWDRYTVHEVYYTDGVPDSLSKDPVSPAGESLDEFYRAWELYLRALEQPVLEFDSQTGKFVDKKE